MGGGAVDSASMLGSLAAVIMTPDDATGSASEAEDTDYGIGAEYQAIHAPVRVRERRAGCLCGSGVMGTDWKGRPFLQQNPRNPQLSMAMQAEQDPLETVSDPKGFAGRQLAQFAATNGPAVTSCARPHACLGRALELTGLRAALHTTVPSPRRLSTARRRRHPASTHGTCAPFVDLAPCAPQQTVCRDILFEGRAGHWLSIEVAVEGVHMRACTRARAIKIDTFVRAAQIERRVHACAHACMHRSIVIALAHNCMYVYWPPCACMQLQPIAARMHAPHTQLAAT